MRVPGRHLWVPDVERWRSLVAAHFKPKHVDVACGIIQYESWGNHLARCQVEWIGPPPAGYDPDDETTRAGGLFQHVPLYWPVRSAAAGFGGWPILDPVANVGTAAYMLYAGWPADMSRPHWHHWSGAHVGVLGSYEKAKRDIEEGL